MKDISLRQIFIYPVKSLAGISLQSSKLTPLGLEYDRRWMIVDSKGRFVTQRLYPQLALISVAIEDASIKLALEGQSGIELPLQLEQGQSVTVKVWRDTVDALVMGEAHNDWISDYLGIECRFVYMPDTSMRLVDRAYAHSESDQVSFADGFPFLLISLSSLEDLNSRLQLKNTAPVPIERFRPNLFVEGCAPYAEDNWRSFRIAQYQFRGVKPCSRCVMTTVNPDTGQKGAEPLATLLEYRKRGQQAYFGQNVLLDLGQETVSRIACGDALQVIVSD